MNRPLRLLVLSCLSACFLTATAHEADQTSPYPGFRPPSEHSEAFLESLDTATIVVLPTIVRREKRSAHSFASQTRISTFLLPVDHVVWGIEVYVLDRYGRNAFSFLLNEHHEMFVDAKLQARNSTEAARTQMIADATMVGLSALQKQIAMARE